MQHTPTKKQSTFMLWDGNRQLQEQTDTHVFTTIYEQDSFEPVARLVWLQDGLTEPVNEPIYNDNPYIETKIEKPPRIRIYHYHNDHLGTPNELTDQDGEVVWLADYEAWGNTAKVVWREEKLGQLKVSAEELQPIRFQGQSFDTETGLHYNRFRYFDPDLGMFISRDPIGLMGGSNVFQYAPNPVGWVDPFGLAYWDKILGKSQSTGTKGHSLVSKVIAHLYAMNPKVKRVTLDLGYKKLLGGGSFKYGPRPDVGVLYKDGKITVIEVASKTDKPSKLRDRNKMFAKKHSKCFGCTPKIKVSMLAVKINKIIGKLF